MSLEVITGEGGTTALFDSTEGLAFGPVFEQRSHAEEFVRWMERLEARWRPSSLIGSSTLRVNAAPSVWKHLYREFFDQCIDGETGQLREVHAE